MGDRVIARLRAAIRRRMVSDSRGFTIVELAIAGSLMAIAGAAVGSSLVSNFNATAAVERRSRGVDELRIGVARLEKEFRSAECVYEPLVTTPGGSATGYRLRFKTRLNSGAYEVTYRVEGGRLYRNLGTGGDEVVATELIDSATTFTLSETTRRRLDVRLSAQPDGKEVQVLETSIAGRNAWRDC